jgi:LytS/YehU family sensor histidine kinase
LSEAKKEAQEGFLNRDYKIKEQQLKQESQLKKFLFIALLLVILAGSLVVRNLSLRRKNDRLDSEKTKSELQQKVSDLEMQALRAQMNPHFIFNCLSSINRFILKNETDEGSDYLTRFSRLIRMVLINSKQALVKLEDEVEMLGLYLDMERMRFKYSFDYNITHTNTVDGGAIQIPPMILQPFCENAIWHGLMNLPGARHGEEKHGKLDIGLSVSDHVLNCVIEDNGIGRKKATELKSKSRERQSSLGLKITEERLAMLNRENSGDSFYKIEDLYDEAGNAAGTRVILRISIKEAEAEKV